MDGGPSLRQVSDNKRVMEEEKDLLQLQAGVKSENAARNKNKIKFKQEFEYEKANFVRDFDIQNFQDKEEDIQNEIFWQASKHERGHHIEIDDKKEMQNDSRNQADAASRDKEDENGQEKIPKAFESLRKNIEDGEIHAGSKSEERKWPKPRHSFDNIPLNPNATQGNIALQPFNHQSIEIINQSRRVKPSNDLSAAADSCENGNPDFRGKHSLGVDNRLSKLTLPDMQHDNGTPSPSCVA